jgi:pyruvate/2-oxoglutarate dehydrogenase complex dihydrolipoamide dehydrogenase (E3) component
MRPRILAIPGLDQIEVLTNRNIMDLQELPSHLIAIGGSYVGLEFGQMFRRLGSEVSVVEMSDTICPREDPEVSIEKPACALRPGARGLHRKQDES